MIHLKSWKLSLMVWVCAFFSALASFSWIMDQSILTHDLTSYIAPIESYFKSGAMPYLDYLDIKPPGMYFFTWVWIGLGADSMLSYLVLHFIFLLLYFYLQLNLIRKFFDSRYLLIVFLFYPILSLSTSFTSMILSVELVGSVLILLGLNILVAQKFGNLNLWLAQVLFVAAGMTKEVYLFSMLLILFHTRSSRSLLYRLKILLTTVVFLYGIMFGFLYINNSFYSYLDVLSLKSDLFSATFGGYIYSFFRLGAGLAFHWYGPVLLALFIFLIFQFFLARHFSVRDLFINLVSIEIRPYLMLFFLIYIGFVWQGKPLSGHYAIALFPFAHILVLKAVSLISVDSKMKILLVLTSFTLAFSGLVTVQSSQIRQLSHLHSYLVNLEAKPLIKKYLVMEPGCLTIAYGWNPGAYLHYSSKNPCSKYFLPELSVQSDELRIRYVNSLISNPPELVVYNPSQADMPVHLVESEVFPWREILRNCYSPSNLTPGVYILKFPSLPTLENCERGSD
jgi:hypothetical protein